MPLLRTIKCDICGQTKTELDYGAGWAGWSIIKGIAAKKPEEGVPLTEENMSMALCPHHTRELTVMLDEMQEENK